MSYLSLTFLCEFRVYLSMEICTKKLQMEYLPTFLIHDRHLAKWEDDVNNKMIFKWTYGLCHSWKPTDLREVKALFLGAPLDRSVLGSRRPSPDFSVGIYLSNSPHVSGIGAWDSGVATHILHSLATQDQEWACDLKWPEVVQLKWELYVRKGSYSPVGLKSERWGWNCSSPPATMKGGCGVLGPNVKLGTESNSR